MTTRTSVKLSAESQKLVIAYLSSRFATFPMQDTRNRLELIDKAMQLESDKRNKSRDSTKSDYYSDTEIPVVRTPISKLSNFLIDTFIGARIFEAVSEDPANKDAVRQYNTVIEENAKATNWTRELVLYFRDIGKYPYAAFSCEWLREEITTIISDGLAEGSNASGAATEVIGREGNSIKRKDLYNTFYDTSVDLNQLHSKGEFSGEIGRISQIALFRLMANLKIGGNTLMNEDSVFRKHGVTPHHYYRPAVKPSLDKEEHTGTWGTFFGELPNAKNADHKLKALGENARYEIVKFNARIIPEMFKIKVPAANKVQIWSFYIVNWDTVIYAERQSNAHAYLPDIFTQVVEEGINEQAKSYAELVIPVQNLSTNLHDAHLASVKRAVDDRAIYDSARISSTDVNSNNPSAKIPVKPNMLKGSIQDAYYAIPYRNDGSASRMNELGYLERLADNTVGFNRPQQGQFQKGNKTLGEFNQVMNNADDDLRTIAKLVETVAFVPLKTIIKTNMLQYQPPVTIQSPSDGQEVTINPAELRRTAMTFKLADGLVDKQEVLDLPTANNLLQLVLQIPQLQQAYNLPKLIDHIMGSVGFDTSKFSNQGTGGPTTKPPAPPTE